VREVDAAPKLEQAKVGRIFREESGRSVAALIRVFGDIDVAEDAVQEAFAVALRKWPGDGLPANPGGCITTTARRLAIDRLRRASRGQELLREVAVLSSGSDDPGQPEEVGSSGRPASPDLHLLPSGTLHRGTSGAHAPTARRPINEGGRQIIPGR
jgi:RNA polymerase sigma-70 factor (ECF subfamily)